LVVPIAVIERSDEASRPVDHSGRVEALATVAGDLIPPPGWGEDAREIWKA
jgi:hypothetical protein